MQQQKKKHAHLVYARETIQRNDISKEKERSPAKSVPTLYLYA